MANEDINTIKDLAKEMANAFRGAEGPAGVLQDIAQKINSEIEKTTFSTEKLSKYISSVKPLNIFSSNLVKQFGSLSDDLKELVTEYHNLKFAAERENEDLIKKARLNEEILTYKTRMAKLGFTANQVAAVERGIIEKNLIANRSLNILGASLAENKAKGAAASIFELGIFKKILGVLDGIIPGFSKIRHTIGTIGFGWGITLILMGEVLRRFYNLEQAAGEFRKTTGIISPQMEHIAISARRINVELAKFGVSVKDVYASAAALYTSFQTTHLVTSEMMLESSKLAANIGIAVSSFAKFSSLFSNVSNKTGEVSSNIIHASVALGNLAGVAPSLIMKDLEESSENMLKFLARAPMQMMRTAVEARRLGTTIKSMADSARGFLNFQDSMNAELEASALIGRNINFQLARQYAWEGSIEKSREEALRIIKSVGDFTRMNVYQQEALAKAANMTVEEVIKQQNQEKALQALQRSGSDKDKQRLEAYNKMRMEIKRNEIVDAINTGRKLADQMLRQHEIEKIVTEIKGAWTEVVDAMIPIVQDLLPSIKDGVGVLKDTLKSVATSLKTFMPAILVLAKGLAVVLSTIFDILTFTISPMTQLSNLMESFTGKTTEANRSIFSLGNLIGFVYTELARITGLINVFKGLIGIFSRITSAAETLSISLMLNKIIWIQSIRAKLAKVIDIIHNIGKAFQGVSSWVASASANITRMASKFSWIGKISKFFSWIIQMASTASKFAWIAKIAVFFGKWLTPIGWIITAIQFVYSLFQRFSDLINSDEWAGANIGIKILLGIKAVALAIFDTLISPFVWAAKTIKDWLGSSPSKIGLSIVRGIASVGDMLLDALTWPFRTAWNLISNIFSESSIFGFLVSPFKKAWEMIKNLPLIGKLFGAAKDIAADTAQKIQNTIAETSTIVEVKNLDALREVVAQLTAAVIKLGGAAGSAASIMKIEPNDGSTALLIAKMDELIALLKAGGIAINLDGRRVSSVISPSGR